MTCAGDVHAADERVDVKPERQADLPTMEAWLPGINWPHHWALRYTLA